MPRKDPYDGELRFYHTSFIQDRVLWTALRKYCRYSGITAPEFVRCLVYEWMRKENLIPEDFYYQDRFKLYEAELKRTAQIRKDWDIK